MKSNAMYLLAQAATSQAATRASAADGAWDPAERLLVGVAVVGFVVLVVWVIRRVVYPRKLLLRHTPGRPNELNLLHLLGAMVVLYFVPAFAHLLVSPRYGEGSPQRLTLVYLLAGPLQVLAFLLIGRSAFRHGLARGLGMTLRRWMYDVFRGALAFLAVFPVCLLLAAAFEWAKPQEGHLHVMLVGMRDLGWSWRVLIFVSAAGLAPVAEELLFRGILQSMVRRYTHSPWFAILAASMLFVLVHAPYWHTMPALLALSLVLGYNYERTGRLLAPIVIHVCFNVINLVAITLSPTASL